MLTIDRDRAGASPGARVLDLGCGEGRHTFDALRAGATVVALDAACSPVGATSAMVRAMLDVEEISGVRFGPAVADALALPFADGAFDVVIASEIFEHLPEDEGAMREVARVLRPGGTLALSVPRCGPERVNWMLSRAYHETPGGHVRVYRRAAIERIVAGAGLRVVGHDHRHGLHSPYWWLRCLVGVHREDHPLVAAYHRFLVWDIVRRPLLTRALDAILDPVVGKSLVLYCAKPR
jgi:SAM-dependent methyltransferase